MRVLIIGLGSIARKHITALMAIDPATEIFAFRSRPDAPAYPGVTDLHDWEAVRGLNPDFVIISNPTSEHARTIEACIPLGRPLFIEKPVFAETGHEEILRALREKDILTYVACDMRFLDCLVWLHAYRQGEGRMRRVNEVNVYCGSYLPEWRPGTDFRKCYSAIPELGGGVHIDLIHDIDYVWWIFGAPQESRGTFGRRSSLGIRAYDYANYCLQYEDFYAGIVLNYYRRDAKRTMEVVFEDGTWTVDMNANRVTDETGRVLFESAQSGADCYRAQMEAFIALVRAGAKTSSNTAFEAAEVLKICLCGA